MVADLMTMKSTSFFQHFSDTDMCMSYTSCQFDLRCIIQPLPIVQCHSSNQNSIEVYV